MAQTRKKRRRKHRGTQGGRIDTGGGRARPRTRAEAKAQARSKSSRGGNRSRSERPPTWRTAIIRAVVAAAVFFALLIILFKRPVAPAVGLALFMLVFYIPAGYYVDQYVWRRKERARMRSGEG